ncbi:hypothetical protein BC941DRAFT_422150 [Chlamydoabsidia padenii]|nr:hypothetical protein BC941DRAFT_422150 [Chlamydoabsidia padenii]
MHRYIQSFSSPTIEGWLMKKARTGLRKTWTRRYFILESQQLRCYKNNQSDSLPISTFDLREYQLQNQSTTKPFTFQLIHQNSSKAALVVPLSPSLPSPDLYLQAENEQEWCNWVDTLERHVRDQQTLTCDNKNDLFERDDHQQVDVLDKWLERYDLIIPRTNRCTSSLLSLAPSSFYDNDHDEVEDDNDSDLEDLGRQQGHRSSTPPIITESSYMEPPLSSNTKPSSRFLGFLWTMNTKKSKVSSSGLSSPVTSSIH